MFNQGNGLGDVVVDHKIFPGREEFVQAVGGVGDQEGANA